MSVNLSIKGVPDALAERLRKQAARHHRSLQRELMAIIEAAVADPAPVMLPAVPMAAEAAAPSYAEAPARHPPEPADGLLAELDAIVAGSQWGRAPVLTREQANDRRLAREFEHDARAPR
jgi:plasmid stability protein